GRFDWDVRAGLSFETSAVPSDYLSVLTFDSAKMTPSLGASMHIGKVRLDLVYAHTFAFDVTVDPKDAKLAQVSPVAAKPSVNRNYINGGLYSARADVIGLGMAYTFDPAPAEFTQTAPAATPAEPKADPKKDAPGDGSGKGPVRK